MLNYYFKYFCKLCTYFLKLNKIFTLRKNNIIIIITIIIIIIIIIVIEGQTSYNVPYKNILKNTEIYLE